MHDHNHEIASSCTTVYINQQHIIQTKTHETKPNIDVLTIQDA